MKDDFETICLAVENTCKNAGHKKILVEYSAYGTDENDNPINNLNEIAFVGKVKFISKSGDAWVEQRFESKIIKDPTWLQCCVIANEMIMTTGDRHHCFLEGIKKNENKEDFTICEFIMGS